jgi:hypothetical protein
MTRSPTVRAPVATPSAARYIIAVKAVEKMRFCPELRNDKDVATLMDAFS